MTKSSLFTQKSIKFHAFAFSRSAELTFVRVLLIHIEVKTHSCSQKLQTTEKNVIRSNSTATHFAGVGLRPKHVKGRDSCGRSQESGPCQRQIYWCGLTEQSRHGLLSSADDASRLNPCDDDDDDDEHRLLFFPTYPSLRT